MLVNTETVFESIMHFALKDPRQTSLGRNIVTQGIRMIATLGFEEMTFKKLHPRLQYIDTSKTNIDFCYLSWQCIGE